MAPPPTFQIKGKLDMLDGIGTKLKVHINVPVYENRYIRTGQVTTRKNLKCQYIFHFSTYIPPYKNVSDSKIIEIQKECPLP